MHDKYGNTVPFNADSLNKITKVAEAIMGTCQNLDDFIEEEFGEGITASDLDIELLRELDAITMECQACGWWCEADDLNEDQVCGDCEDD